MRDRAAFAACLALACTSKAVTPAPTATPPAAATSSASKATPSPAEATPSLAEATPSLPAPAAEARAVDVKVDLPAVPSFELPPGALSVKQLRVAGHDYLGKHVTLHGFVSP